MQLKDQRAFITGATAGIGLATAELLASKGCHLLITGRRKERLESIAERLRREHKIEIEALCFDVTDSAAVQEIFEKSEDAIHESSILINNAGLALGTDLVQNQKFEDMQTMINTNVMGLLQVTRLLLPILLEKPEAHIINLGSVSGRWAYPGGAVYCASKFAVRAISEGLRMDLVGKPIRVTNIEPGMVETEFSIVRLNSVENARKVYQGMTPLTGQDVAETIVWCLERPAHVNIQELVVFPTDQPSVGMINRRK